MAISKKWEIILIFVAVTSLGQLLANHCAKADSPTSNTGLPREADPDDSLLQEARISPDAEGLIEFLRSKSATEKALHNVDRLISQLGSRSFQEREEASKTLVTIGAPAVGKLSSALVSDDKELVKRAQFCIARIDGERIANLASAAIRKLVRSRHPNALAALLQYLPSAPTENTLEDLWFGIDALAVNNHRISSQLLAALNDPAPARRALAACICARAGDASQQAIAGNLLSDPDPLVRLRVAQGLLAANHNTKEAIPVLIALLREAPITITWQAEELLHWVAGTTSPDVTVGAGADDSRRTTSSKWGTWWSAHKSIPQSSSTNGVKPRLLLVCINQADRSNQGYVCLCGCDGKPRWQRRGLAGPTDIQLMPNSHVLIAESQRGRVSEQDLRGNIVREWKASFPVSSKYLANGNIFITGSDATLTEIGPDGKTHYALDLQLLELGITDAVNLPNGHVVAPFNDGKGQWLVADVVPTTGKVLRKLKLPQVSFGEARIEVTTDARTLVTFTDPGLLMVCDDKGNLLSTYSQPGITCACRLRSGHTIVGISHVMDNRMVEVDAAGHVAWEATLLDCPLRVRRCLSLVGFGFGEARDLKTPLYFVEREVTKLQNKDVLVRRSAASAIARIGQGARGKIPVLIEALDDPDVQVRREIAEALVNTGLEALPFLVRALKDGGANIRFHVAIILGRFGPLAQIAVPELTATLRDPDPLVRQASAETLSFIREDIGSSEMALRQAVMDENEEVRVWAIKALAYAGAQSVEAKHVLLRTITTQEGETGIAAAQALAVMDVKQGSTVRTLVEHLKTEKRAGIKINCMEVLGRLGSLAKPAVPELTSILKSPPLSESAEQSIMRKCAALALGGIGEDAVSALPALISLLKSDADGEDVRVAAIEALGNLGLVATSSIPALVELIERSPSRSIRQAAYAALGNMGSDAVPALLRFLKNSRQRDALEAERILRVLASIGPSGSSAVPEWIHRLTNEDPAKRAQAALALGRIGLPAQTALPALLLALRSRDPWSSPVPLALARIAPRNQEVKHSLVAALHDTSQPSSVRAACAHGLATLGNLGSPLASDLHSELRLLLSDKSSGQFRESRSPSSTNIPSRLFLQQHDINDGFINDFSVAIVIALGRLGPQAQPAAVHIVELLRRPNVSQDLRYSAMWSLERIGPAPQNAISELMRIMSDLDSPLDLRVSAASTLASYGRASVPRLSDALSNPAWSVRFLAIRSLGMIGGNESIIANARTVLKRHANSEADQLLRRAAVVGHDHLMNPTRLHDP